MKYRKEVNIKNSPLKIGLKSGCSLAMFMAWFTLFHVSDLSSPNSPIPPGKAGQIPSRWAQRSLAFEKNVGQTDPSVRYLARANGYSLFLTPTQAVWVRNPRHSALAHRRPGKGVKDEKAEVLWMRLKGANPKCQTDGQEVMPGISNYFIGRASHWKTKIPQFAKVRFRDVYPGIDLVYYGSGGSLEYDFVVRPKADPRQIRLKFEGGKSLKVDESRNLEVALGKDKIQLKLPAVYQPGPRGKENLQGRFVCRGDEVGFEVGSYDSTRPLVIDPTLVYSTYVGGGTANNEYGSMTVDPCGFVYLVQYQVPGFPTTPGAYQTANRGTGEEILIVKLNLAGSGLVYSTYLGGTGGDFPGSVAADSCGNAYVTGNTSSTDFPTTAGAFQAAMGGAGAFSNAFVTKINPSGTALVYSTYLGGNTQDIGKAIAVDSSGNAYVAGDTESANFPTTSGAYQSALAGSGDAFVAKLNSTGTGLVYSTFLGGTGNDGATGIALDGSGFAYVAGNTNSTNFPTTPGAYQAANNGAGGNYNAFITKVNALGTGLVYSTYLGGDDGNSYAITVDSGGNAYITGMTTSTNFPVTPGVFQAALAGSENAFVAKLNSTGTGLVYSTYLGGMNEDDGRSIAVDAGGNAYVTGLTGSTNFPTTPGAFQTALPGISSAYLTVLNPTGTALVYSTFWGGSDAGSPGNGYEDDGTNVAFDASGALYLTGNTYSTNFPTTGGAYQTALSAAQEDLWATKFTFGVPTPYVCLSCGPTSTNTPTGTPTPTFTPTLTPTPTLSPTVTPTITPTDSPTITPTVTPTFTPTCVPHVWPDPFNPRYALNNSLKFGCLPTGAIAFIYTLSGELVDDVAEEGGLAQWKGNNQMGVSVSPGVYYYVVKDGDQVFSEGKFLVMR